MARRPPGRRTRNASAKDADLARREVGDAVADDRRRPTHRPAAAPRSRPSTKRTLSMPTSAAAVRCPADHVGEEVDADHRAGRARPRRAARKQSIPPPDPRSTTCSPGRRPAWRTGLLDAQGDPDGLIREAGELVGSIEALRDPPIGREERAVSLADSDADRVLREEIAASDVGHGGSVIGSPAGRQAAAARSRSIRARSSSGIGRLALGRRPRSRAGGGRTRARRSSAGRPPGGPRAPRSDGGSSASVEDRATSGATASRQSIMVSSVDSHQAVGGPRSPRVPARAACGRGGAATGWCPVGPRGSRRPPCRRSRGSWSEDEGSPEAGRDLREHGMDVLVAEQAQEVEVELVRVRERILDGDGREERELVIPIGRRRAGRCPVHGRWHATRSRAGSSWRS